MGCVPSQPEAPAIPGRNIVYHHDQDDTITATSSDETHNSFGESNHKSGNESACPYDKSVRTGRTTIDRGARTLNSAFSNFTQASPSNHAAKKEKQPPGMISVLLQTILLFGLLAGIVYGVIQAFPADFLEQVYRVAVELPTAAKQLYESIVSFIQNFNFAWLDWLIQWPWWNMFSDQALEFEFYLAVITVISFVADLLTSDEESRGNWILLMPSLLYSLASTVMSIHAQVAGLIDLEILFSFDASEIGKQILSQPEIVLLVFTRMFAFNLALAFTMMKDFYHRVTSRQPLCRFAMAVLVVVTSIHGPSAVPIYLFLRYTFFAGPTIQQAKTFPMNRNSHKRELEYLLDPVPRGGDAMTGWINSIPAPLDIPLRLASAIHGIVLLVLSTVLYFFYICFFCLPVSALFISVRRTWKRIRGQSFRGAVYGPFEIVQPNSFFPPKALVVVSGHLRLMCFKRRGNWLFEIFIGWWLNGMLETFVVYEFSLSFASDISPYCAFLMEEFGPVFPMGKGLGFGSYKDVKRIIENPDQRKSGVSLAWRVSEAQYNWSKNNLTMHPETENEKSLVAEGRKIVQTWIKGAGDKLKDDITRKRLDAILPFANADGSMLDEKQIMIAFGSTLFHLHTGGEYTESERQAHYRVCVNASPFFSDWLNQVFWVGGAMNASAIDDYDALRHAILRYLEAPNLQEALALPEKNNWGDWTPQEVVRFLTYKFLAGGGLAPCSMTVTIIKYLYENRGMVAKYKENKRKFILEMARLAFGVPMINFLAYDFGEVTVFGQKLEVPNGATLHASIQNANRDESVFGPDAGVHNFDRNRVSLGHMMTFNGNQMDIAEGIAVGNHDSPPRRCPGYGVALEIMEFLVDRFAPADDGKFSVDKYITPSRYTEIRGQETAFMKIALGVANKVYFAGNKYFPHASEVKHPLDTKGKPLNFFEFAACGRTRKLPQHDEDTPSMDTLIDAASYEILQAFPITDDEGDWKKPEEGIGWRMKFFSSNFPPVNEEYNDSKHVAEVISEFAFSGLCCLHTRKVSSYPKDSLIAKQNKSGAMFVNDNTSLGSSKVRRGYQRYGAAAYFDEDGDLVGIYTYFDGKYTKRPLKKFSLNDSFIEGHLEDEIFDEWRHAMWVWKVSALAQVTVVDHLLNLHLIEANTLVSSSRAHLPIDHALRSFLKIFTYRTVAINAKAYKTLTPINGVIARCWAFENDSLQELLWASKTTFKKRFPDHIHESMRDVSIFPANDDLKKFWKIVRELVHDMVCVIYDAPEVMGNGGEESDKRRLQRNINNDQYLQAFLKSMAFDLGLLQSSELSQFEDIVDVLSSLICAVTGMHELVGQISDYFAHPKISGTTIRLGKQIDSIQIYQLGCTLVASTGLRMPRLMGNWEHLLNRNRFASDSTAVLRRFQDKLRALSLEIEEANRCRKFKMEAFNPTNMESSVSV